MGCKDSEKGLYGDQWNLGATKDVTMGQLWDWDKVDSIDGSGDLYLGPDRCNNFKKEICLELGKSTWRKHHSTLQEHVTYTHNDIVKLFRVCII